MTSDLVRRRVGEQNHWYVSDQRATQLGTPGARWALEQRWRLFERAIDAWLTRGTRSGGALRVLDAGCGDGISMSVLEAMLSARGFDSLLIGSDYNGVRLSRATDDGRRPVVEADLRHAPFVDGAFDVVLCSHVLEHISEDVTAMRELARMVAPDGLVIVAVPNEGCASARLRNHILQRSILRTTDHVQFYTAGSLITRLGEAGLRPIEPVMGEGVFLPHLGVYTRLRETALGRSLIEAAARLAPGQSAGLVVALERGEP